MLFRSKYNYCQPQHKCFFIAIGPTRVSVHKMWHACSWNFLASMTDLCKAQPFRKVSHKPLIVVFGQQTIV